MSFKKKKEQLKKCMKNDYCKYNSKFLGKVLLVLIIISVISMNNSCTFKDNLKKTDTYDSGHYLKSPWVTERVGWYFLQLPEKWELNPTEVEMFMESYSEVAKDYKFFNLFLKDMTIFCSYIEANKGIYESWDLDKSATATINQVLNNLECRDVEIRKNIPYDDPLEVNYSAYSGCSPFNHNVKLKGVRFENHIIQICIFYNADEENLDTISDRIIDSFENKYIHIN